jgi:hypothetical protein
MTLVYIAADISIIAMKISWFTVLTYSMYFSYAIFLIDYKKILKIAGGVKQLTVPLLLDLNCSMPENNIYLSVVPARLGISVFFTCPVGQP